MQKAETETHGNSQTKCEGSKHSIEHLSTVLPFSVLEKVVDKPLRIRGVAMTAGMSRNFNIYTPQELEAFSSKLVNAPVYIEHVAVPNAVGKVTKTDWDGKSLWYEAEIYESEMAEKIRKGLVQHVSVGADYEAVEVVDGKVPHGLHNAELSLVAVPGIPETNVQVLESLAPSEVTQLRNKLIKAQNKLAETETKLSDTTNKFDGSQNAKENFSKVLPEGGLLKEQPKLMPISEHIRVLEALLPTPLVERATLGMQRECQLIRCAIFQAKETLAGTRP
jgi:hypothetical protein